MNDLYSELDRKVNLLTNNKSIYFYDSSAFSSKKIFYFFDGVQGRVDETLDTNICGTRYPNGSTGWYSYIFASLDTSKEYSHQIFEDAVDDVQLGGGLTGSGQCYTVISPYIGPFIPPFDTPTENFHNSLAIHRATGIYYVVTGIQITNSGSGYTEENEAQDPSLLIFKHKSGFGPFSEAYCSIKTGVGGSITGIQMIDSGTYFKRPPEEVSEVPSGGMGLTGSGFAANILTASFNSVGLKLIPSPGSKADFDRLEQVDLILEGSSSFTFPKKYDKYKFFRIHNLNNSTLNFTFEAGNSGMDTSAGENFLVSIPMHSSRCVRRDFGKYTTGFLNFQKFISGDGRFDGNYPIENFNDSMAVTQKFYNNIYDPIDHGMYYLTGLQNRFVFDKTKYWNGESLYCGANKPFRTKEDSAPFGDLYYHTGDMLFVTKYLSQTDEPAFQIQKVFYSGGGDPFVLLNGQLPLEKDDITSAGYSIFYTGSISVENCVHTSLELDKAALFPIRTNLINNPDKIQTTPFKLATILDRLNDNLITGEYYLNNKNDFFNFKALSDVAFLNSVSSYPLPGACCIGLTQHPTGFTGVGNFNFAIHKSKPLANIPVGFPGTSQPEADGYFGCNNHCLDMLNTYSIPVTGIRNKYVFNTGVLLGYESSDLTVYPTTDIYTESFSPTYTGIFKDIYFTGAQSVVRNFSTDLKNTILSVPAAYYYNNSIASINFNGVINLGLDWSGFLNLSQNGAPVYNFLTSSGYTFNSSSVGKKDHVDLIDRNWSTAHSPRTQEFEFSELPDYSSYVFASYASCEPTPPPDKSNIKVNNNNKIFIERDITLSFSGRYGATLANLEDLRRSEATGCVTGVSLHSLLLTGIL